jgi:acyl-CoA thioester hydrolase
MAAVEQNIQYKRELLVGDIVAVYSVVNEMKEKVIRFTHEMRKADTDEVAAITTLTAVHLDKAARRACAFPGSVREKGAALLARA